MTTGDWLGLVCLAAILGFFCGGFFVWQLFFKRQLDDERGLGDDEAEAEEDGTANDEDQNRIEEAGT